MLCPLLLSHAVPSQRVHGLPAAQEAHCQLNQLALYFLLAQHCPWDLPRQRALRVQRGWEVTEEGIQEARGLLCHLAALLWGSRGHAQSIPGGLLPGLQSGFTLGRDVRVSKNRALGALLWGHCALTLQY